MNLLKTQIKQIKVSSERGEKFNADKYQGILEEQNEPSQNSITKSDTEIFKDHIIRQENMARS